VITVALRGLAGRKLRAFLTALAIVLGVTMVSGTYVLTDTIKVAFDNVFTASYAQTDAVITGEEAFSTDFGQAPPIPESLLAEVRQLPGVEVAAGAIQDTAPMTTKDGDVIETNGAPALAFGIDPAVERFNPTTLTDGRWPTGPGEVVIDAATAEDEGYRVGDTIGIAAGGPVQPFEVVGIAKYGAVESLGSATFAVFELEAAQQLFDKQGKLDAISVAATPGTSPEQLVEEIRPLLPENAQVQSGTAQAEEESKDLEEFVNIIQYFLLAFGGIALFVGAFVIFNTLSITVAQRTREFATLRTLGASRRQVLWSVVVEALVIGLVASVIGLFLGLALASGLNSILVAIGLDLPTTDLVFATRTIVVSLLAGTLITLVAGLVPAIRATRVPPIAAVREGAELPKGRLSRWAPYIAIATTLLAVFMLVRGMFFSDLSVQDRLFSMIGGVIVLFIGVALLSSRFVKPLAAVLGWPARRIGGTAGKLARENAMRNPGRTASTAAALMIGLALISFVAILAQGLRASVGNAIEGQVTADYVVSSEDDFSPFEPAVDEAVAEIPGASVVGVRGEFGQIKGSEEQVTGVDPERIASVYDFDWIAGSGPAALEQLNGAGLLVEEGYAEDEDLALGDTITIVSPAGQTIDGTVAGLFDSPVFWQMLGQVVVSQERFDEAFADPKNLYTFIDVENPTGATGAQLEETLQRFPQLKVGTREQFVSDQQASIDPLLNLLYVLLALSVIVSLFGIVNTLVLSVFERTREIGMLRAVGMTRRQVRRMIRHEAVITALIGATLGMALGIFLAVLVTQALSDQGVVFSAPVGSLIVFLVVAIVAGMLAAILPARRAARLNVLNALQYE